jgi:hypothetical protein
MTDGSAFVRRKEFRQALEMTFDLPRSVAISFPHLLADECRGAGYRYDAGFGPRHGSCPQLQDQRPCAAADHGQQGLVRIGNQQGRFLEASIERKIDVPSI